MGIDVTDPPTPTSLCADQRHVRAGAHRPGVLPRCLQGGWGQAPNPQALEAAPGRTTRTLGGDRLLAPRDEPFYGVPALERLDRDVFAQSGVRSVVVFEGINDIGFDASADDIIGAYRMIIAASHAHGLRVVGATLTPFKSSFVWTDARGRTWQQVNDWIRTGGGFDGVIDFATAIAAPDDPFTLAPAYDSGDGLHPNDAGTQAMADSIDLSVPAPGPVTGSGHGRGR